MKVKVVVEVDVDRDAWACEFGLENTAKAVRDDVKIYFAATVEDQLERLGLADG